MANLFLVYQICVLLLLLAGLATVVLNLACFEGLRPAPPPAATSAPKVSILVPARNEERSIRECVGSLLAQDYPDFEVLVLDDQSTDATPQLLAAMGFTPENPHRRLLQGRPLESGWVGKNWACHQLAEAATGDYLFFTDADTEHAPGTVSAAMAYAQANRASLVSAWPRLVTVTWGEQLIIPMILLLGLTMYPHWLILLLQRHPAWARAVPAWFRRGLGAANGQFMFWQRTAYAQTGGHLALRSHLVEDVALGRAVAARIDEGLRLFNCESLEFSRCRMYRSFDEVWEGFTKNVRPAFESQLPSFLLIGTMQVCGYLGPFLLWLPAAHGPTRPLAIAQLATIAVTRILLTVRFRTSWWSVLLHPLSEALAIAIGLNSWRLSGRRGVTWKGRRYAQAG